ncbi:MAG: metal-dependent hydrolase [Candidatus Sedimenticola sp. (ex Thyasira tokunagai)]
MNGATHKTIAAATGFATLTIDNHPDKQSAAHNPLIAAPLATFGGMLPDLLEPASHGPHHRQFFHSVVATGLIGYGVYKAYKWEPQAELEKCLRIGVIMLGVGYLSHLIADSSTPRSLPVI